MTGPRCTCAIGYVTIHIPPCPLAAAPPVEPDDKYGPIDNRPWDAVPPPDPVAGLREALARIYIERDFFQGNDIRAEKAAADDEATLLDALLESDGLDVLAWFGNRATLLAEPVPPKSPYRDADEHERQSLAGTHLFDAACFWCLLGWYEHPPEAEPVPPSPVAGLRESDLTRDELSRLDRWRKGEDGVSLESIFSDAAAYPDVSRAVRAALLAEPVPRLDVESGMRLKWGGRSWVLTKWTAYADAYGAVLHARLSEETPARSLNPGELPGDPEQDASTPETPDAD